MGIPFRRVKMVIYATTPEHRFYYIIEDKKKEEEEIDRSSWMWRWQVLLMPSIRVWTRISSSGLIAGAAGRSEGVAGGALSWHTLTQFPLLFHC